MASLNSKFIADLVATARKVLDGLMVEVHHESFLRLESGYGKPVYSAPVTRKGILNLQTKLLSIGGAGSEIVSTAQLTFLEPVDVSERDRITLPNGTAPPIVNIVGPASSGGGAYITTVWFGTVR